MIIFKADRVREITSIQLFILAFMFPEDGWADLYQRRPELEKVLKEIDKKPITLKTVSDTRMGAVDTLYDDLDTPEEFVLVCLKGGIKDKEEFNFVSSRFRIAVTALSNHPNESLQAYREYSNWLLKQIDWLWSRP